MGTSKKSRVGGDGSVSVDGLGHHLEPQLHEHGVAKSVTTKGTGGMGAIMPHTVSSIRYVERDTPYQVEALKDAGLPASDMSVVNAHCGDATEFSNAQADITKGDKVLITTDSAEHKAVPLFC